MKCPSCNSAHTGTGFTRGYCTEYRFACNSLNLAEQTDGEPDQLLQSPYCIALTRIRNIQIAMEDSLETDQLEDGQAILMPDQVKQLNEVLYP
jgi:hypothetical protein